MKNKVLGKNIFFFFGFIRVLPVNRNVGRRFDILKHEEHSSVGNK